MSDDVMKALDEIEAALAEAETELKVAFEALGEFANILSREPYEANRAYDAMSDMQAASRCIPTLRAALTPPADEPGWLKGMDEASAVKEIAAQMGVPPADDEISAIRARHEAADKDSGYEWARLYANQAHTDRATLLRALDEAQERAERAEAALANLADCQPLPKVYKYTGTAEVDVENMFDVGHRHRNGKQPRDYLMSWLSMFRPFAYATKDDSWGELEKLISITMNNYVQILVKAEKARAAQTLKERKDG